MTTITRDWQVAHAALTHAGHLVSREAEAETGRGEYRLARVLHLLAATLHQEALSVIGQPSTREVLP